MSGTEAHASGELPDDVRFMRMALALAERGAGQVAPNPKVGAVIVRDGQVVGEGWHARYGEAHAEVHALAQAGARARGATVYVSLEPCNHHGKTPPCTDALMAAGVARVVYAAADPNPRAAGGAARLRDAGVHTQEGPLGREARLRNAPFFFAARGAAHPFVTVKLALSVDGAVVDASRQRRWLTGELAQQAVHALRAEADGIVVGIGTALADDPALTVRHVAPPRIAPVRIVFDRQARLPLTSALVRTAHDIPVVVVAATPAEGVPQGGWSARVAALEAHGVTVLRAGTAAQALAQLHAMGRRHLLVEGGAVLASALLADGLADHLIIFQAPVILGAGAVPAFVAAHGQRSTTGPRLQLLEHRDCGADLMTRYAVSGD
jgi:diaminohydroxyphosphoribosylaminopyrimidine deaminase/5-amino-6-(5-phosphoribosylamino)uracil reductase